MNKGLRALLTPIGVEDFTTNYEMNRPFVVHHSPDELTELRQLPFLSSLEALLDFWEAPVEVHLPDLRDEASAMDVPSAEAKNFFERGMGLLFNDANRFSPVLQEWVNEIRKDLGISALTYGRSLIYATPDGKGTAAHFDQNINFVLQLHGTKKWTLAENSSVTNPMVRHTLGLPVDPEMESYLVSPMPETMPDETTSFDLRPGSLLFVPRGMWHMTEAHGDALALNFTFTPPTWADLLLTALRSRLVLSPEWRETAFVDDEVKFSALLSTLIEDVPHWSAGDILGVTES